jgi:CHAT domain-containing protein
MNEHRQSQYLKLIEELLSCPIEQEPEVWGANQELIDAGLSHTMEQVAVTLKAKGEEGQASFLTNVASFLVESLTWLKGIEEKANKFARQKSYKLEKAEFLERVLQIIHLTDGSQHFFYPLLAENLDKIDDDFAQILDGAVSAYLLEVSFERASIIASVVGTFSNRIQEFSGGNKASCLEIAIAGYNLVSTVFTKQASPPTWAMVQNNLSIAYRNRIRADKAENLETAIACANRALQVYNSKEFSKEWAMTQLNLGSAYIQRIKGNRSKNLEKAIACYEEALTVYTKQAFPSDWALVNNNLSAAYRHRIEGERADNLEQAISLSQEALSVYTSDRSTTDWAQAQNNLAAAYSDRIKGDREENLELAINHFKRALRVFKHDSFRQEWSGIQHNLGSIYNERIQGDIAENIERAIAAHKSALTVRTREEFPLGWANTQNNLSKAYENRICGNKAENLENALRALQAALEVYTYKSFPEQWATVQLNSVAIYCQRVNGIRGRNLQKAIAACNAALKVYTRADYPEKWAACQNGLGNVYGYLGNIECAIECFKSSLEVCTPTTIPLECYRSGRNLGDIAFKADRWQEAIDGYHQAIEAVEQSRTWVSFDLRKQEILQDAIGVYLGIVQSCIYNNQPDLAIEYIERSKARNLIEILTSRKLDPKGNFSKTILNELDDLRQKIAVEQRRVDLNDFDQLSRDDERQSIIRRDKKRDRLNALQKQLDELIAKKIQPIDPTFNLTQKIEPISFAQIRELLPNDTTAFIYWYSTGDLLQTFIITRQSKVPTVITSTTEEIEPINKWIKSYLQNYTQQEKQWKSNLEQSLQELAELLKIDCLISQVPSECDRLILIPNRILNLLPFHALPINNQQATNSTNSSILLDRFPGGISYTPSCQLLQLTRAALSSNLPNIDELSLQKLFGIQNPLGDLSYTDLELAAIQQMFQKNSEILVKNAATKTNLNDQNLQQADYIHFSCHGYFNFQEPRLSALLLSDCQVSPEEAKNKIPANSMRYLPSEDGGAFDLEKCLTLGEIFALNLENCRLVTLSACETGLTEFTTLTDEYVSLPSGFLYAGSPNVVSSLWTVNDFSTAFLMIKFYQNLDRGNSVVEALNQAQVWLRNITAKELLAWIDEKQLIRNHTIKMKLIRQFKKMSDSSQPFKEPYFWAAFCAIGQ